MKPHLKELKDQVVVITGATSGIGLATARMAARRGARLVLTARNSDALGVLADEIKASGGQAIPVSADVVQDGDLRQVAEFARQHFGGFDTWINNAGLSIYGKLTETPLKEHRQLFDVNYWGMVQGSLIAVEHLRERGGALINIGSIVSDRAIPLQGAYSASKHAIKGFTDALRMEIEADGLPISVTLIKPTGIDTPFTRHARNHMAEEPQLPPPVYAPEVAAEAILYAAEHPVRDLYVGGAAKMQAAMGHYAPRIMDRLMEWFMVPAQKSDRREDHPEAHSLYGPMSRLEERGGYRGHVARSSMYTRASLHPLVAGAVAIAAATVGAALLRGGSRD